MSSRVDIRLSDDTAISLFDPQDQVRDRFRDVKHSIQDRSDWEVTNQDVLNVLLDLYWIHHENGADRTEGVYL